MRPLQGKSIFNITSSEIGTSSNVYSLKPPHVLSVSSLKHSWVQRHSRNSKYLYQLWVVFFLVFFEECKNGKKLKQSPSTAPLPIYSANIYFINRRSLLKYEATHQGWQSTIKSFAQLINSIIHGKFQKTSLKLNRIIQNFSNNIMVLF